MDLQAAKVYAFRRLASKSYFSQDLADSMRRKGFSEASIATIVELCQSQGYINDQEWLDSFFRRELDKNKSIKSIVYKLLAKRVDFALLEPFIEKYTDTERDREKITKLLETKYAKYDKKKAISFLIRKGYNYPAIIEAMKYKEV